MLRYPSSSYSPPSLYTLSSPGFHWRSRRPAASKSDLPTSTYSLFIHRIPGKFKRTAAQAGKRLHDIRGRLFDNRKKRPSLFLIPRERSDTLEGGSLPCNTADPQNNPQNAFPSVSTPSSQSPVHDFTARSETSVGVSNAHPQGHRSLFPSNGDQHYTSSSGATDSRRLMKQPRAAQGLSTTLNPDLAECPYTLGWIPSYPKSILGGTEDSSQRDDQSTIDHLAYQLASFSIDVDLALGSPDVDAPIHVSAEAGTSGDQEYDSPPSAQHAPLVFSSVFTKDATPPRARYQDSGIGSSVPGITSDQTPIFTIPPRYHIPVYGHSNKQNAGARSRSDEHHDAADGSSRETHAIAEHGPTPKEGNSLKRKGAHNQSDGGENSRKRKKIPGDGDGDETENEEVGMPTSGDDQPTCPWPDCRWNKTKRFTEHFYRKHILPVMCPKDGCSVRRGYNSQIKRHIKGLHRDMDPEASEGLPQNQSEVNHYQEKLFPTLKNYSYKDQRRICSATTRLELVNLNLPSSGDLLGEGSWLAICQQYLPPLPDLSTAATSPQSVCAEPLLPVPEDGAHSIGDACVKEHLRRTGLSDEDASITSTFISILQSRCANNGRVDEERTRIIFNSTLQYLFSTNSIQRDTTLSLDDNVSVRLTASEMLQAPEEGIYLGQILMPSRFSTGFIGSWHEETASVKSDGRWWARDDLELSMASSIHTSIV